MKTEKKIGFKSSVSLNKQVKQYIQKNYSYGAKTNYSEEILPLSPAEPIDVFSCWYCSLCCWVRGRVCPLQLYVVQYLITCS